MSTPAMLTTFKFLPLVIFSIMIVLVAKAHETTENSLFASRDTIVFAMYPDYPEDAPDEIFTMNSDGSNLLQLTFNNFADYAPIWSPDLNQIAFISNRDGNAEIYIMDADGSDPIRLTNNTFSEFRLAWWDNKIAFESNRDGDSDIYVMNDDGSNPINLTNNSFSDLEPAWSPNGEKIAFVSNRDGYFDLYIMDADGSDPTRLTFSANTDYGYGLPAWSPDGTMIAFRGGPTEDVYRINADGTNFAQVTTSEGTYNFAWLPTNSHIAFNSAAEGLFVVNIDGTGRIQVDLNWPSGVTSFSVPINWQPDFIPAG